MDEGQGRVGPRGRRRDCYRGGTVRWPARLWAPHPEKLGPLPEHDRSLCRQQCMQARGEGLVKVRERGGKTGSDLAEAGPVGMKLECVARVVQYLQHEMDFGDSVEGVPNKLLGFRPRHAEPVAVRIDPPDAVGVGFELWGCH